MICKVCGKEITEDWRKGYNTKKKPLETCSLSCSNIRDQTSRPAYIRNETEFENWVKGSSAELTSKGLATEGELRVPIKTRIKEFLLEEQNNKCAICGQINVWNGKPFTLILDHIDGNPTNHIRNNLRLICPICDTQLPTHGSKNRGKGRHSERKRYYRQKNEIEKLSE